MHCAVERSTAILRPAASVPLLLPSPLPRRAGTSPRRPGCSAPPAPEPASGVTECVCARACVLWAGICVSISFGPRVLVHACVRMCVRARARARAFERAWGEGEGGGGGRACFCGCMRLSLWLCLCVRVCFRPFLCSWSYLCLCGFGHGFRPDILLCARQHIRHQFMCLALTRVMVGKHFSARVTEIMTSFKVRFP